MNFIIKILASIKHKIIFLRFGRIYRPDTVFAAGIFQKFMQLVHKKEFNIRKNFIKLHQDKNLIIDDNGYEILSFDKCLSEKSLNSLSNLKAKYNSINWMDIIETQKKPFLCTVPIGLDSDLKTIVEDLAPVVANYIGSWPVFLNGKFWFSPNTKNFEGRSQNWHMDAEDVKQLKILIPVDEITQDHGPMKLIPANITNKIYYNLKKKKKTKFRNEKHQDELINSVLENMNLNSNIIKSMTIKKDQIALIDTCRCYHYGSRKAINPRKIIALHFTSAFSIETPIFRRNIKFLEKENIKKDLLYCFQDNNYLTAFENSKNLSRWQIKIL